MSSKTPYFLGNNFDDPRNQQLPSRTPKALERLYSIVPPCLQIPPILKTPLF